MNAFCKSFFCGELGKTLAQRSLTTGKPVRLFANVSGGAAIASTATLSNADSPDSSGLRRKLHSRDRPCSEELNCVDIRSSAIYQQFKTIPYTHHLVTADYVPGALGDLVTSSFYA